MSQAAQPKPPRQRRANVQVFMDRQLYENVRQFAIKADLPVTTFCRHLIRKEMERRAKAGK